MPVNPTNPIVSSYTDGPATLAAEGSNRADIPAPSVSDLLEMMQAEVEANEAAENLSLLSRTQHEDHAIEDTANTDPPNDNTIVSAGMDVDVDAPVHQPVSASSSGATIVATFMDIDTETEDPDRPLATTSSSSTTPSFKTIPPASTADVLMDVSLIRSGIDASSFSGAGSSSSVSSQPAPRRVPSIEMMM